MWLGFHEDIKKLTEILKKNLFPAHLVERVVNQYLTLTCYEYNPPVSVSDATTNFYFKLPYIGPFSVVTLKKVCQFAKCYCNNIDIKLVFSSFKIGNMFKVWETLSLVGSIHVCFTSFYVWVVMPAMLVKPLYIYPHVYTSTWSVIGPLTFSDIYTILHNVAFRCSDECFNIQDHASTTFQLEIKEAIHI